MNVTTKKMKEAQLLHFAADAWEYENGVQTKQLRHDAIPTVFPPLELLPKRRSPFKKMVTAILSPRSRIVRRIKALHGYAKSPSKEVAKTDSQLDDNPQLDDEVLCKPLSPIKEDAEEGNDATAAQECKHGHSFDVIHVRDIPAAADANVYASKLPSIVSSPKEHILQNSPSPKKVKKYFQFYRSSYYKQRKRIKHLGVQLARSERRRKLVERQSSCKGCGVLTKIFNQDQILRLKRKDKYIKEWSVETIKKAYKLRFTCGTAGYEELLRQGLPFPSVRTLNRRIEHLKFKSGILYEVLDKLKIKIEAMKEKERDGVMVVDEMSLTKAREFDVSSGELLGDVTLPGHFGAANHALVFMLGGINSRWKQTVAYYYTGDSTDGETLKPIVLELISLAEKMSLKIWVITSDMGSLNQGLWRAFGIQSTREKTVNSITHPEDPTRKLFFLADAPHLLKNIKGMLLSHRVISFSQEIATANELPAKEVRAEHIETVCTYQRDKELKLAPRLKPAMLTPSHYDSMSVYEAYQVLNIHVANSMEFLVQEENKPKDMLASAWFLKQVYRWFELVTSRHPVLALSFKNKKAYDEAIKFLEDIIELFKTLKYGEKNDGTWKPIQTGVILTTMTLLEVQEIFLKDRGYGFLLLARFTQDCLENLFSVLRSKQRAPSPLQFRRHLKMVTVAQYMKPVSHSNYDEDDRAFLGEFFEKKVKEARQEEKKEEEELSKLEELIKDKYIKLDIGEENSLYNVAGYIVKQVSKASKVCDECYTALLCHDQEEVKPFNTMLKLKEYKEGALVAVNLRCFQLFQKMESFFRSAKILFKEMPRLKKFLDTTAQKRIGDAGFPNCHKIQEKLIARFITFRLRIYAQFCSPKNEEFDFSSKSGNAKTLAKQVGKRKRKSNAKPPAKQGAKRRKVTARTQAPAKNVGQKRSNQNSRSKAPAKQSNKRKQSAQTKEPTKQTVVVVQKSTMSANSVAVASSADQNCRSKAPAKQNNKRRQSVQTEEPKKQMVVVVKKQKMSSNSAAPSDKDARK